MARERWTCPGCQRVLSVEDASAMVLCRKCSKVESGIRGDGAKQTTRWVPSDFAFVGVASVVAVVGVFLLAYTFWQAAPKSDPDKRMVEQWLRENLNNPSWEEVKWYPARTLQNIYDFNLLHICEGIEKTKATYEKGLGKEEHKAECQQIYDKFSKSGLRTFCALKFRAATQNGESKMLRQQVFEIVDDKAKALPGNEIRELAFTLADGSSHQTPYAYDGWKLFEDKEYEPFPPELLKNLDTRIQAALVWKEPAPAPVVVETPQPLVKPQPKPEAVAVNMPAPKPKEVVIEKMPLRIREYYDRVMEAKTSEIDKLEKRLSTFKTKRRSSKSMTETQAIDDRISQTEDALAELKRTKLSAQAAPLPQKPDDGDIGWFQVVEVTQIVDAETLIVRWHANGKGKLPRKDVAIYPIATTNLKVGDTDLSVEFVKVSSTSDKPSDLFQRLTNDGIKVDFIVTPTDKGEIDNWHIQYEKEAKPKK